jgi:hypothetical protein
MDIIMELKDSLSKNDGLFESSFFDSLLVQINGKTVA